MATAASCKPLPCSGVPVVRIRPQVRIAHFAAAGRGAPRRVIVSRAAKSFPPVNVRKSRLQVGATAAVLTGGRAAVAGSSIRDRTAQLQHAAHNPEPPKAGGAASKAGLVWFRSDLRTDDNEALFQAHARCSAVLPVYVFDPRDYGKSPAGFDKVGPYKAKFLLESLADLRARLRDAGSDLVIARGKPEEVLPAMAKSVGASAIYAHADVTQEDCLAERNVRSAAEAAGAPLKLFWGSTLFHLDDLPFAVPAMPTSYGPFREMARTRLGLLVDLAEAGGGGGGGGLPPRGSSRRPLRCALRARVLTRPGVAAGCMCVCVRAPQVGACAVREALKAPSERRGLPAGSPDPGEIPTLASLGISELPKGAGPGPAGGLCGAGALVGGEAEAQRRLRAFLSGEPQGGCGDCGAAGGGSPCGANFSCKVSPWLALGCLSPRRMYWDLKRATEKHAGGGAKAAAAAAAAAPRAGTGAAAGVQQGGLQWLVFELLWRDFFRLTTLKYTQAKAREALTAAPAGGPAGAAGGRRAVGAPAGRLEQLGKAPTAPPARATAFAASGEGAQGKTAVLLVA